MEEEWKACIRPSAKQGLYLLSDKEPLNDCEAYQQLGAALFAAGDEINASIAYGIASFGNKRIGVQDQNDERENEIDEDMLNPKLMGFYPSSCDGPCHRRPETFRELHHCPICDKLNFCEQCVVLVKTQQTPFRICRADHPHIRTFPGSNEAQAMIDSLLRNNFKPQAA